MVILVCIAYFLCFDKIQNQLKMWLVLMLAHTFFLLAQWNMIRNTQ